MNQNQQYNQGGYNNQGGYPQGGYAQGGYAQGGYAQQGQMGYNQGGYAVQGSYNSQQGGYAQGGGYNQGYYNQGGAGYQNGGNQGYAGNYQSNGVYQNYSVNPGSNRVDMESGVKSGKGASSATGASSMSTGAKANATSSSISGGSNKRSARSSYNSGGSSGSGNSRFKERFSIPPPSSDQEKEDRKQFMRKVFATLSICLGFTALVITIVAVSEGAQDFYVDNPWFPGICGLCSFAVLIYVFCNPSVAREYPKNYIALGLYTFFESLSIAALAAYMPPGIIVAAGFLTAALTTILTLYALYSKKDFTTMGGFLWCMSLTLFLFLILAIFMASQIFMLIICFAVVALFCLYIIYDVQLIAGGKQYQLSLDDYILGALYLYIDIVILFYYLAQILYYFCR